MKAGAHSHPLPHGATRNGEGVNAALFSAPAQMDEPWVFDPSGRHGVQRIDSREQTDSVCHGQLPEAQPLPPGTRLALQPGQAVARPLRAQHRRRGPPMVAHRFLLRFNARHQPQDFKLPFADSGLRGFVLLDAALDEGLRTSGTDSGGAICRLEACAPAMLQPLSPP